MRAAQVMGLAGPLSAVVHDAEDDLRGTLVVSHGFRGSRDGGGRAVELAMRAAAIGFNVLRYDFSPLQTLSRQLAELSAVVEWTRSELPGRTILLGRSMGGSASLAFAARDGRIAGLCLWATPWNLVESFSLALGPDYDRLKAGRPVHLSDEWGEATIQPDFIRDFDRFDLWTDAQKLPEVPLFAVHGDADAVVPVTQARALLSQASAYPKELLVIPGGDHQFLSGAPAAAAAVCSWLERSFPPE